jgi:phosphopantothenoylcysteine decarboxylase/phosphopantothenate--cysteine ligase
MIPVTSAVEMMAERTELPRHAIFTAALPTGVAQEKDQKIKKDGNGIPDLQFVENPDILQTIAKRASKRPTLVVALRRD